MGSATPIQARFESIIGVLPFRSKREDAERRLGASLQTSARLTFAPAALLSGFFPFGRFIKSRNCDLTKVAAVESQGDYASEPLFATRQRKAHSGPPPTEPLTSLVRPACEIRGRGLARRVDGVDGAGTHITGGVTKDRRP
jgi:hypothetical protein